MRRKFKKGDDGRQSLPMGDAYLPQDAYVPYPDDQAYDPYQDDDQAAYIDQPYADDNGQVYADQQTYVDQQSYADPQAYADQQAYDPQAYADPADPYAEADPYTDQNEPLYAEPYQDAQDALYPEQAYEQTMSFTAPVKPPKRTIFKPRTRKPSFILAVLVSCVRLFVLLVLILGLSGMGALVGIAKAYVETSPTLDLAAIDDQAQTSFIYDADGNLITDYKGTENRVMIGIDKMPQALRYAFVAVEDERFYIHNGVDVKRIVGAFVQNFVSGSQQGGSTITQQLIKNTVLSCEQSYKRKIQEAYLAMQLETRYSKDEILECYLNTIYLGENYYGVQVASVNYFGKENLFDLTLRECAMLAGMTNNPYYYNPRRNFFLRQSDTTDYAAITNDRTDYVLRCMYENQFITKDQYLAALNTATATVLEKSPASTALYPYAHYVEYAISDVVQTLLKLNALENTSANRNAMENELRTGGYHVYLALDTNIQSIVEDTLSSYSDYPSLRNPSDRVYRARNSDGTYNDIEQPQAAAVVIDYRTGEVKAIVGSRYKPTQRKTLNRAVNMNMPVGSSIKPIAVYAPALDLGAGAGSILYNIPVPIKGWTGNDGKDSWPQNYGGSSYRGPETVRTAITKSDNTAAAYALMNFVGVERSADYLLKLGVSESRINRTPFGVALGSSGITPFEMAVAFGVLGNGGVYQSPVTFLGIADSSQRIIYDSHANQTRRQVFKPSTAWLTIDMLKDVVSSGTGTAAKISGRPVAGKTGTNSDQKGVFFAGLTDWYCGTVWIGHDNYKALSSKTTGGNSAAKLWKAFMTKIHAGLPVRDIMEGGASDYGLVKVTTCGVSGQLATDACRNDVNNYGIVTDYWPQDSVPTTYCQMHYTLNVCTTTGMLAGEYCPVTSRATKGVVLIPIGHPLYDLIGTQYSAVLGEYLGQYATLRLTNDQNANNAMLAAFTCNLHSSYQSGDDSLVQWQLLPDARNLLTQAQARIVSLDPSSAAYAPLYEAINYLSGVVNASPDRNTLVAAMSALTQALANAR